MRLKVLAEERYRVVATMDGDDCPAEQFLLEGEAATTASRTGLLQMLSFVAAHGLAEIPAAWSHQVNKGERIYEFKKGPLRLFFFEGEGRDIAICTSGVRKSGQKVDKQSVKKARKLKNEYGEALAANELEIVSDENE